MDILTNAYNQLVELLRAMTPRARITAALLLVVVVASLAFLWRREVVGESTYLLGGQVLSLDEITAMQGALGKAQLNDFAIEGNRILIPKSKQAAYLAALADADALPQTINDIFSEASESSSWFNFPTRQQQIEQTKAAKRKWLAAVLRRMEGVDSVEVDFEKEEPHGLKRERAASAVVFVKLRGGQQLDDDRACCFARLVSAALLIDSKDVTVVDKFTHAIYGGHAGGGVSGGIDDPYRAAKRRYQAYYEETLRKALAHVPGVTISADVELERELRREETRVEFDHSSASPRANEGAAAVNAPPFDSEARPAAAIESARQPAELRAIAASSRALWEQPTPPPAPAQRTTTEIAGLTPKHVAVSIGVPTSYFETLWRQSHTAAPGGAAALPPAGELARLQAEEMAQIRQCASGSIAGANAGARASTVVTVTPFRSVTTPDSPQPSPSTVALEWVMNYVGTIATVVVSLVFLLVLRSVVRSAARVSTAAAERAGTRLDTAADASKTPAPHFRTNSADRQTSRSLQEELTDMVRDDPAAAADILRSWIGSAR